MVRWALRLRLEKSLVASHDVERCTSILSMHTQNRARVKRGQCLLALAAFLGCEVHLKNSACKISFKFLSTLFFFFSRVLNLCPTRQLFIRLTICHEFSMKTSIIHFFRVLHSLFTSLSCRAFIARYQVQTAKKRRKIGETNAIWNSDWLNGRRRFHSRFLLLCFFSGSCAGCGQKKSGAGRSAAVRKRARRPPQRAISSAWSRTDG